MIEDRPIFLNLESKTNLAAQIRLLTAQFLIQKGFNFMLTSSENGETDVDFCLRPNDRLREEDVEKLEKIIKIATGFKAIAVKNLGKNDGGKASGKPRTKYAPFANYLSAGVFALKIINPPENKELKLDIISGYTLIDEKAKKKMEEQGRLMTISSPEKGKKKQKKEPILVGAPKIDLSLALTNKRFYEQNKQGIKVLSRPLKGIKYLLEAEALEEKISQNGQTEEDKNLAKRLADNWENNWQAWLEQKGEKKAFFEFIEIADDFLELQVRVSNLTQDQADALLRRLEDKLISPESQQDKQPK